jgi:hypothetical protein
MITTFDTTNTNALHEEASALLKALAEKHGLTVRRAGGQIDGSKCVLKFEFRSTSEEGEKADFAKHCVLFNCKPEDYGRVATINGKEVTLVGFELSRRKFPIRVRGKDGKVSLFTDAILPKYFHTGSPVLA